MAAGPVQCRLDDMVSRTAVEACGFRGSIHADVAGDVTGALREVRAATDNGLWAVGLVSYEAAPAFDPALAVATSGDSTASAAAAVPLVWFGLFDELVAVPMIMG